MRALMSLFVLLSCLLFAPLPAECSQPGQEAIVCLQLVNKERTEAGIAPLVFDDILLDCTDIRAQEIVSQFSHTRPDGSSCFSVMQQHGVNYNRCGENIAYGTGVDGAGVYDMWLNSPPHHENYMNPKFDRIGISSFDPGDGNIYWVQLFSKGQQGGTTYVIEQSSDGPSGNGAPAAAQNQNNDGQDCGSGFNTGKKNPGGGHGYGPGQTIAGKLLGY